MRKQPSKGFFKNSVIRNFAEFTRKYLCRNLFFIKLLTLKICCFIENKSLAQVFPCEFCKICKNTLFAEHHRTTASYYSSINSKGELTKRNCKLWYRTKAYVPIWARSVGYWKSFTRQTWWNLNSPANIRLDEDVLKTSWKRLWSSSSRRLDQDEYLRLTHTPSRRLHQDQHIRLGHTSSRRFQDVFKTSSRHFQDNLTTSSRRLKDVLKTSSRRLQDIFKTFARCIIKLNCFR